jgi:hypothetical protein
MRWDDVSTNGSHPEDPVREAAMCSWRHCPVPCTFPCYVVKSSIRRARERDQWKASKDATGEEVHGRIVSGRHDASCLRRPLCLVVAQDTVHGAAIRGSSDDEEVVAGSQLCRPAGRD